ncbi:MAG: response regulator transcription factor [Micrococcus sp.]|nr:response regulator transcription factor [Micrococcus sp.]
MESVSVMVVDDEELLRQAFTLILQNDPGLRVVASAADGACAVAEYERTRPDVVVMDLRMPQMDGIEATQRIISIDPDARILVVTSMTTQDALLAALNAGASGYVAKDIDGRRLIHAVRDVAAGNVSLGTTLARRLLSRATSSPDPSLPPRSDASARDDGLTQREDEVLQLLCQGLSNREIGEKLFLSESTVKASAARVMAKLGTTNRVQTLLVAAQRGYVSLPHATD